MSALGLGAAVGSDMTNGNKVRTVDISASKMLRGVPMAAFGCRIAAFGIASKGGSGPILLKNSNIWISKISAKSTTLLKLIEDCRERPQGATTAP